MTATNQLRQLARDHEFDLADDAASAIKGRRNRVRRLSFHRVCSGVNTTGNMSPKPNPEPNEVIPVARHVPNLSRHGRTRLQQRGIAMEQVLTVLDYVSGPG